MSQTSSRPLWRHHVPWVLLLAIAVMTLLWGKTYHDKIMTQLTDDYEQQQQTNISWREEQQRLQEDIATETELRTRLGDAAYRAVFDPPPRAQLVAEIRQLAREAGLKNCALTLSAATPINAPATTENAATNVAADQLMTTQVRVTLTASDDIKIYRFLQQLLAKMPDNLGIEQVTITRNAITTITTQQPELLHSELLFNWITAEDTSSKKPQAATP